ncbi:MAG: acyltransferase family protein [Pyrinomonadaceae bacterium]
MAGDRLISLDVFRGITIAAMILVNNPGTSPVYWPLDHAEWNGLTPTDWIFPFFLFIVGVAIPISLGRNATVMERADRSTYTRIFTRSISIFLLGLAISVIPFFQFAASDASDILKLFVWLAFAAALFFLLLRNYPVAGILTAVGIVGIIGFNLAGYNIVPYNFGTMRIFGVLQRIAVCYLVTSLIFLNTNWKQQLGIAIAILLGYWFLMTSISVPGCDVTTIDDKACNLAAYLDRLILGENHIWRFGKVYDPEGILSTLPAIATTLSGVLTGKWLLSGSPPYEGGVADVLPDGTVLSPSRSENHPQAEAAVLLLRKEGSLRRTPHAAGSDKAASMFFFGTVLLAVGFIWNSYFPFNKSLWTSSYVVITTGLALLVFAACYWLIDIKGYKRWALPFVVFGANALSLFVFSGIFARMMSAFRVAFTVDGKGISAQKWLVDNIFLAVFEPINASLAYAICFILFWLFLMWLLFRKHIFIKV